MGQPVPIEPEELEFSLLKPIRYFELLIPPDAAIENLADVSVAAEMVASVQPVKSFSKPGFVIKLTLSNLYFLPPMESVSPVLVAPVKKLTEANSKISEF